ncbi:MAG: hypothetical protein LLF93_04100 [Bacteroidales bacterium]|nr:hypothetical protein [Bacteroidales bacterium]
MVKGNDKVVAYLILSEIEANPVKMFSWGFSVDRVIDNGLLFRVRGLKHKGKVKVICNKNYVLFEIQIIGKNNVVKYSIEDVSLDQLVKVLDLHIERVENYGEVVSKMYGLPPKKDKIDTDLK